jgi:hypothetical protein
MHTMPIVPDDGTPESVSVGSAVRTATVITATLIGFDPDSGFLVLLPGEQETVPALSAVALSERDIGCSVLLTVGLRQDDFPVITGRRAGGREPSAPRTRSGGDRLVLQATREIELRCGDSSIVLTRAGKVLVKGNFVLTHARGINRIRGACVQIN